jgi:phosphoribosylformimino-5-aminoimidazole carboxamide ribotide isomerase
VILYPAIDLLHGKCVRLTRGDFNQVIVYSDDPAATASEFAQAGASWIHVVDLDGARTGAPGNLESVRSITRTAGIKVQLGGGIRDAASVQRMLDAGVERCVIGTAALNAGVIEDVARSHAHAVAVGLDIDAGTVRVSGWTEDSGIKAEDLLGRLGSAGLRRVIVTDISRDGTLSGPNTELLRRTAGSGFSVIASGGIAWLEDLRLLAEEIPQLDGIIVGKAIYEKRFSVAEGVALLRDR